MGLGLGQGVSGKWPAAVQVCRHRGPRGSETWAMQWVILLIVRLRVVRIVMVKSNDRRKFSQLELIPENASWGCLWHAVS